MAHGIVFIFHLNTLITCSNITRYSRDSSKKMESKIIFQIISTKNLVSGDTSTEASLEAGVTLLDAKGFRRRQSSGSEGLRGPCRLVRLCVLGILLPAALISIPLYVRYHLLHEQYYPVAFSDVRIIDKSVSTTWCQVLQ
jgi:hypothetical protein